MVSVKLAPTAEQWARIRELAWEAMRYRNQFIRARWAEAMKLVPAPDDGAKNASIQTRNQRPAQLSGSAYSAAEREASAAWQRDAKRIMAGAPMSQWREADSLSVRGHRERDSSGVRIESNGVDYVALLQLQSKDCEGGSWLRVEIAKHTRFDEFVGPLLSAMAAGERPIYKAVVMIRKVRGRMDLRLCYGIERHVNSLGQRVATLGPLGQDYRLSLRSDSATLDMTARIGTLLKRKEQWDLIRRRAMRQIGRRKGAARAKREFIAHQGFDEWLTTFLHSWSREAIAWCVAQGVGEITVVDLAGGSWPQYRFMEMLRYKGEESGVTLRDASMEDAATQRAAKRETERARTKAKKLQDAVSEIASQL